MPLYEYACQKCGERIEVIQKMADAPVKLCPQCGGELRKLISSPAIQFKGSGFYKTDYPSSTSSGPKSESKPESKSESKSETKGESKTETKSESKSESKSETKSAKSGD